jgi:hypothetical protein
MKHQKICAGILTILASAVIGFSGEKTQKPVSKDKTLALRWITDMAGRQQDRGHSLAGASVLSKYIFGRLV